MGNAYAYRGRLTPALIALALLALAIVAFGMVAGPASARPTFEPVCVGCHTQTTVHAVSSHAGFFSTCATCHVSGTSNPPPPSACAACHGGTTAILAKATHTSLACGTTPGCHGYTSPSPTPTSTGTPTPTPTATAVATTMTAKVAPTTVKVKKTVKVTGTAGPAVSLAGAKVTFKVERKVGTKWVKMKTGSATVKAGAFKWSYKTAKKGSHRVTSSIAATSTHTKKAVVKTFKVK
jgi:hypothetical protein